MTISQDKRILVLIVDDDEVDRIALKRALGGTHFELSITEAADASAALAQIDTTRYDCIFLDYNLPGRDGLSLTKAVRARGIKVPVIVLTGQGDEQTAVELMKAGASDYLPKSKLSAETIARIMRSAIRMYQAEALVEAVNINIREKNRLLEKKNRELAQQQQYIYEQNLQLQEVSRLKSEFVATMSHELRTPLNAIIGFSQILLNQSKGKLSDTQDNMLNRVLANGRALLELINDILAFSRIESGRLALVPAPVDIAQVVNRTVEDLRSQADQKSLSLEVEINLDNPLVVNDASRLRQILMNLISNAIKFTEQGSVNIQLSALPADADRSADRANFEQMGATDLPETNLTDGDAQNRNTEELLANSPDIAESDVDQFETIVISVADTGCGIKDEDQPYIFYPFHQVDQKVTRRYPGTGLGLSITHSLVKLMHGNIKLSSQVDRGSTFTVEIPRTVEVDPNKVQVSSLVYLDTETTDIASR